ncbi:MAG: hypothetical protein RLZZ618_1169 [Pseudomonadota bacterium]
MNHLAPALSEERPPLQLLSVAPAGEIDSVLGALDASVASVPAPVARFTRVLEAWLPFTVRMVCTDADLLRVQGLRALSYGRHLPGVGASFGLADPIDRMDDTTVLIAEDKHTGDVVGSLRIQTNLRQSLQIEHSVELPEFLQGQLLAEITRLSVMPGYSGPVRLALVKASHLYCVAMQISGVMAGSRPSLLRLYRSLGFAPVYDDGRLVPLRHAGNLPHHILVRDMVTAEAESRQRGHADYPFVFRTYHPDIALFDTVQRLSKVPPVPRAEMAHA